MDESTEEEDGSTPIPTISNAHVVILRTNLSNEQIDKIFLDIAMALKSAGHIVSFLCCHINAEISDHMQDFDISKVFRWVPASLFGFFKTPLRLLSSTLIIIWLKIFRNYMYPTFVITDSFVVLPILRRIGVNVVHFYQFEEIYRRSNRFCRLLIPFEKWFLKHANKILLENRTSLGLIQRVYQIPLPTEVLYLTAAYNFVEQNIHGEQIVISRLPPNIYYFLVMGIYGPQLNIHNLIKAFELLLDRISSGSCNNRKNVYLIISGYIVDNKSLKFFTKLKNFIAELRHESKIILFKDMGMLIQKYLIANCKAVLLGEINITSCSPILECLSVGAIVISAKSDYANELISNQITGFVIDPTPEKFFEIMFKVLEDEIFVGYMKYMTVLDYFNRFSFSSFEQQLQKIVENMVNIYNETTAYRYLSTEAYTRYLIDTLQLLRERQMFESEGPMSGSQLKEMLFQMHLQIIQRNNLENLPPNEELDISNEDILVIDLGEETDEQGPRDLSSISNIMAAVQLGNLETEPQPGPSGLFVAPCSSNTTQEAQSRLNTPKEIVSENNVYLAPLDPTLNKIEEKPQPGPSGLSNIMATKEVTILKPRTTPSNTFPSPSVSGLICSTERPQSDLSSLSTILSALQARLDSSLYKQPEESQPALRSLSSIESISTTKTLTSKLQIEQKLSGLYDQYILLDEVQLRNVPEITDVKTLSTPLDVTQAPISTIDKGKRKMGTKIGEGRKKTSKPQSGSPNVTDIKSSQGNRDSDSLTLKSSTIRKSSTLAEKKTKIQTQSDLVVSKKHSPIFDKEKQKLTKTKPLEKQQLILSQKADLNKSSTSSAISKRSENPVSQANVKSLKVLSHGIIAKPALSKDKSKKLSEPTTSKSSCLLSPTGVKIISSSTSSKSPAIHGNRFQATSANNKKKLMEKIYSSSAPLGGLIVTSSGGKVKPKNNPSTPSENSVIKSRIQTPSSNYKKKTIDKNPQNDPPIKILEKNIKLRTSSSKTGSTQKTPATKIAITAENIIQQTTKSVKKETKDRTPESIPEADIMLRPEYPEIPVLELSPQPNNETTQENISSPTRSSKQSTTSVTSSILGEKRMIKRRQKPRFESDTKRIKLESKSLPDLSDRAFESDPPVNVRRSEPIQIDMVPITQPPPPARVSEKKVRKICLRHSPRIKLVPVTSIKIDTSTLRSSTLTQIISPRKSRKSIGGYMPLKSRSLSSKGNTSPRLLVKGRSILTVPKPSKTRSPRSGAYKLETTTSEEQNKDLRRPLRKTPAATDLRICRLRRRCRFCTFRYVPVQRLPTGEVPITTVFPPSGVESESSIEGMEPREILVVESSHATEHDESEENALQGREKKSDEDKFQNY